jgi:cell division protein FtsL
MNKAAKSQRSKIEKIVLVAVIIVVSLGIAYMAYDYVTTMEQLDNLNKELAENSSLTDDSNINSDLGDVDT